MSEEKEKPGIDAGRAGLGLLTGILGAYLFPTFTLAGRLLLSTAYTGLAAVVNKLSNPKEKTSFGTSVAEGASHFVGRTIGDYLRHGWSYAGSSLRYALQNPFYGYL